VSVAATDLALRDADAQAKVVGKFVEFHGEGVASLPWLTGHIANMARNMGRRWITSTTKRQ
jgi:aconitase A